MQVLQLMLAIHVMRAMQVIQVTQYYKWGK